MPFLEFARRSTCAAVLALGACVVLAPPVPAADSVVAPAASPTPAAGPTVAAAKQFCGDAIASAAELITRYSSDPKLMETYKSVDYVAYSDSKEAPTVMYTFTTKGHPAHPSAVCRKQSREGENIVLHMEVVCDAAQEPCDKLRNEFNVMHAQMQTDIENKIKENAGK